ncbi:MAG TPA: hypothetical protein VK495_12005 [Steroidobacteraceae bacterium]|nr:hypothetical protein [Steroidobacteraceae bacterium]
MFDLNFCFGMFELGSGAKIGRPCYLVISATGGVRRVDATRVFMLHLFNDATPAAIIGLKVLRLVIAHLYQNEFTNSMIGVAGMSCDARRRRSDSGSEFQVRRRVSI